MSNSVNMNYASLEQVKSKSNQSQEAPKNDLDKNAFLNLLVTQMRYQDPLNPTSDREFLAQMAQFTALEQMQNLNQNFSFSQGTAMIGKGIQAIIGNPLTGEIEYIEGIVEAAQQKNGKTFLLVGGKEVPIEKVEAVVNQIDISYQDPYSFIGKIVQAQLSIKEGEEAQIFEGIVDHIEMKDGEPHLSIYGKLFSMDDVIGIVEGTSLVGKWIEVDIKAEGSEKPERKLLQVEGITLIQDQVILISGDYEFNMKEIHKILNESK